MNTRHWKVAIAGEAMVSRPFSAYDEPEFLAALKLLMEGHKMTGMTLHPVEMGRDVLPEVSIRRLTGSGPHPLTEGRPLMADKENGNRILERLQRLSAEYGTKIEIKDGVGILKF